MQNQKSENKKIQSIINPYETAKKVDKVVRGLGSNIVNQDVLIEKLKSADGLTQKEAGILIFGSEENWQENTTPTRNKIRKLWNNIDPDTEVAVSHKGSENKQVYFIVKRDNYKYWYAKFIRSMQLKENFNENNGNRNKDLDKLDRG